MKLTNFITLYIATLAAVFLGVLLFLLAEFAGNYHQDKINSLQFEQAKFQKELILKCQELAAYKTNPKWGYGSCINNLGVSISKEVLQ